MAEDMAKERKILVAVDKGEESMYALSWCLKNVLLSGNTKDTIILLYVKPVQAVYTAVDGTGYLFSLDVTASVEKYSSEVAGVIMEKAKKICTDFGDVKVETRVGDGDPRDVICQTAEQLRPHVLVMGTHGYGLLKRAFLGSVSHHCAQNAKCPVLVVKRPKSAGKG